MRYIIAYDIEDDKKRNRLAKLLEEIGLRLQKSVFECELSSSQIHKIASQISEIIDVEKDSVIIFPNCKKCQSKRIYIGATYTEKIVTLKNL